MAVDLSELIGSLRREVNPPGGDAFPDANDASYLGYLQDAFWEVRLDGMLAGFNELDGIVKPETAGDPDLSRDLQQLLVLYGGIRMVRTQLTNLNTVFRAKAGAVEYETQQSAQVLKAILDELKSRRALVLERLSDLGVVPTYYIDGVSAREHSIDSALTYWVG